MKSKKIYMWIIVVLVLLNISTISTILFHNYRAKKTHVADRKNYPVQQTPHFFKYEKKINEIHSEEHIKLLKEYKSEAKIISVNMQEKRKEILEKVWNTNPDVETRTVDNFIARLRKYFEPNPSKPVYIKSVRSAGYLFTD